jgi:probable phosphoglycerate mutase
VNQIWLIRHGETKWSLSGQHTGRTDIPLTEHGRRQALALGDHLPDDYFSLVLCSPLERARETCRLAGFDAGVQIDPNLREWDYGEYEGLTTARIRQLRPSWDLFRDGVPGGETLSQVAARALDVLDRAAQAPGDVALFAHAHILRILAAQWIGLPPHHARHFALAPASISLLGYERETRVLSRWNFTPTV